MAKGKKIILKKDHYHKGVRYAKGYDVSKIEDLTKIQLAFLKVSGVI